MKWRLLYQFFWGVGLAFVAAVALGLTGFFYPQRVLTVDSGAGRAEVMVVLGGSPERPQRAAELFKAGEAPLIICSGYGDDDSNKKTLIRSGVPAADILLEPESRTTQENAEYTIALLRARHLTNAIIVTSWFHSRRALACFEHYAPDLKFYSRPSYAGYPRTEWRSRGINHYVKTEYVKLLGYWLFYGVCPF